MSEAYEVVIPCIQKETAEKIYNQIKRATGYEGEVRKVNPDARPE